MKNLFSEHHTDFLATTFCSIIDEHREELPQDVSDVGERIRRQMEPQTVG
jgi:hypothetical protein